MTVLVIAAGVVLAVLLLPVLTFRWAGHWWCTPYIKPAPVRELEASGDRQG